MDTQKIISKLQRELKRNPKKTAILALGLLVAGYYWAPLVAGWLDDGEKESATSVAIDSPAAGPPPATTATTSVETEIPQYSWMELLAWIEQDPRMRSADLSEEVRDPFLAVIEEETSDPALAEQEVEAASLIVEATPRTAGLVLTATLVAGNERWAQISGGEYRTGDTVSSGNTAGEGQPDQTETPFAHRIEFRLEEIHNTYVVLSRGDRQYRLALDLPALPPGSRFEFAGSGFSPD